MLNDFFDEYGFMIGMLIVWGLLVTVFVMILNGPDSVYYSNDKQYILTPMPVGLTIKTSEVSDFYLVDRIQCQYDSIEKLEKTYTGKKYEYKSREGDCLIIHHEGRNKISIYKG